MLLEATSFWDIKAVDVAVVLAVIVAYLSYRLDKRAALNEVHRTATAQKGIHDKLVEEQTRMHEQNRNRLDILLEFHKNQLEVNRKRDLQITELQLQTATLTQIARGIDRRLEMLEDKNGK